MSGSGFGGEEESDAPDLPTSAATDWSSGAGDQISDYQSLATSPEATSDTWAPYDLEEPMPSPPEDTAPDKRGAFTLDSRKSWRPESATAGQCVELDAGLKRTVLGVVVQGDPDTNACVTKFGVCHRGDAREPWRRVPGIFDGNFDGDSWVMAQFPAPVEARHLRLEVASWHDHPSLRLAAIFAGTVTSPASVERPKPPTTPGREPVRVGGGFHLVRSRSEVLLRAPPPEWGQGFIGPATSPGRFEVKCRDTKRHSPQQLWIQEDRRTYSSKRGSPNSELDSQSGWQAETRPMEWLEFDLGGEMVIGGSVIQGCADTDMWVTEYHVGWSTGVKDSSGSARWHRFPSTFKGSSNRHTKVYATFPYPITARYVQLVAEKYNVSPGMRADLTAHQGSHQCVRWLKHRA